MVDSLLLSFSESSSLSESWSRSGLLSLSLSWIAESRVESRGLWGKWGGELDILLAIDSGGYRSREERVIAGRQQSIL